MDKFSISLVDLYGYKRIEMLNLFEEEVKDEGGFLDFLYLEDDKDLLTSNSPSFFPIEEFRFDGEVQNSGTGLPLSEATQNSEDLFLQNQKAFLSEGDLAASTTVGSEPSEPTTQESEEVEEEDTESDGGSEKELNSCSVDLEDHKQRKTIEYALIKMIDDENVDFLESWPEVSDFLKEFLSVNIELITKQRLESTPEESFSEWSTKANACLKKVVQKRNDQKLRLVFNKMIKLIINRNPRTIRINGKKFNKFERFYMHFAPEDPQEFKQEARFCKFPSCKRLKTFFGKRVYLAQTVKDQIVNGSFLSQYEKKKFMKGTVLLNTFRACKEVQKVSRADTVSSLKNSLKSYPWSQRELKSSCDILLSTLPKDLKA